MTARRLVVLSAAVGLLLAAGHTTAQVPPAEPGYDKRLKALEDKMDRVLAALLELELGGWVKRLPGSIYGR